MRKTTLLVLAIVLTAALIHPAQCASKQSAKPAASAARASSQAPAARIDAPQFTLPAGAVVVNEMNFDQQNLLGAIKQALPAFSKGLGDSGVEFGGFVKIIDLKELASCIEGITALRIVQFSMGKSFDAAKALPQFESQVPDSKGWKRLFYSANLMAPGVVAAYSLQGKSYLGVLLDGHDDNNYYVGTVGFVDLGKLAGWTGRLLKGMSAADEQHNAPSKPVVRAPAPAPAK